MKKMIIAAALFISTAAVATAQPGTLKDENHRIQKGVYTGKITRSELNRLKAEEAQLRSAIYRYKKDGRLSPWERKDLAIKERQLNENIYRQTHDRNRY
jgi:Spy/CpxP family protein refolding chaperone